MKALVFAAGIGSRLKPWTDSHPKALVRIGNKPMLERVVERIREAGIRDIIINVHHFADQIVEFVENLHCDVNITISDERDCLLETGGGLRKVIDVLEDEPVLVHNADIFTDFDIKEMIRKHESYQGDVTLLTGERKTSRYFVFDKENILKGWVNVSNGLTRPQGFSMKDDYTLKAFDGVHIISPRAYKKLRDFKPAGESFSIVDFYLSFCDSITIKSYDLPKNNFWFDIGKPEALVVAEAYILKHKNNW